ncbi:hypothetical protein IIE18_22575 [Pseudomonas sp. V1]|nr:hypothetical protein [Pseudomonas arcuscaelestis]
MSRVGSTRCPTRTPPTTFDREAVHDLYRDHAQWLHSWIRRRLGDNDRAADITQEVQDGARCAALESSLPDRAPGFE